MVKLNELRFELLPHPPYSPDLATSDYWLFADIKKLIETKDLLSDVLTLDPPPSFLLQP